MEGTNSYSGLFIIDPDKEKSASEVHSAIRSIIEENAGNIVEEKKIGKKRFAYPIKKKTEGVYYEILFTAPPSAIAKVKRMCEINTGIMRTLIDKEKKWQQV